MTRGGGIEPATAWGFAALVLMVAPFASAEVPTPEAYQLHCSGCHGADGRGVGTATPPLTDLTDLMSVPGGRDYLARVPGVAQAPLESAALARLLNWTLREFSDGPDFEPYTADEIEDRRKEPLRDPLSVRAKITRTSADPR